MAYSLNAPCHCGSGKKYKRCCRNSDSKAPIAPKPRITNHPLLAKLADGNSHHLLANIAGLQLHGPNHGKNIRLEQLVMECLPLFKAVEGKPQLRHERIEHVVESYKDNRKEEDPPTSAFTENIMFVGGNFTVLPGISTAQTELLNQLLFIITANHNLPESFRRAVIHITGTMLVLSDMIAECAGLPRYMLVPEEAKDFHVIVPDVATLERYAKAVTIDKVVFQQRCEERNFQSEHIRQFIIDPLDPVISAEAEEPYITRKMIVETADAYICVGPTTIVTALVHFIYEQAEIHGIRSQLMTDYYATTGLTITEAFFKMGFHPTSITLPTPPQDLPMTNAVFAFDRQKFAHICIVRADIISHADAKHTDYDKAIANHADQVASAIKTASIPDDAEVFTIYILPEIGSQFTFGINEAPNADRTLSLRLSELIAIAYYEDTDNLSLWKFSGAYDYARGRAKIFDAGGILDTYAIYHKNHGSILPSDDGVGKGGAIIIQVGSSNDFQQQVKHYQDEHSLVKFSDTSLVYSMVKRYRGYGPLYIAPRSNHQHALALDLFPQPIWAICDQQRENGGHIWAYHVCEAILFWLMKMKPSLAEWIEGIDLPAIEITVTVDGATVDLDKIDGTKLDRSDKNITCNIHERGLKLYVPAGILDLVALSDNRADKSLMQAVLKGLNQLPRNAGAVPQFSDAGIKTIIDNFMIPDNAKMLLYNDASHNIRIDPRNLASIRYLQDADTARVLDQMVGWLGPEKVPEKIVTLSEKVRLTNDIVTMLNNQMKNLIAQYDGQQLLKYLIARNERAIQAREFREIYLPARIACFSSFDEEVKKLKKQGKLLVPTALAYRTLIEYVATKPPTGGKHPNTDNIDYMVALMDAINDWGVVGDTLHLQLDDPEMGLLPSGRIGMDKSFDLTFNEKFRDIKITAELFKIQENFEKLYVAKPGSSSAGVPDEVKRLDIAFEAEFGITLTQLSMLMGALMNIGFADGHSCIVVSEATLVPKLLEALPELTVEKIRKTLKLLSLQQRPDIATPIEPYKFGEIAPWRYNRSLSYLRRPLACVDIDEQPHYLYGYRHLLDVMDNFYRIIGTGKLSATSEAMKSFVGEMAEGKGKAFRNRVRDWFKENSSFEVIDHEVKIDRGKHLDADKNYGDIDLLVIDHTNKIVYSLECKAIYGARNILEMKTEVDHYLGRPGNENRAKIGMHMSRHNWLRDNYEKLVAFLKLKERYEIRSMLVTAEPIPLPLLKATEVPLSIIDFVQIRMKGVTALK